MFRRAAQVLAVGVVVALLGVLVWDLVSSGSGARLTAEVSNGKTPPAPAFDLPVLWPHDETWPRSLRPRLADGRVSLRELRGHPVVVNFWASWCVPCKEEAPAFVASAAAFRGRVVFLGIDVQDLKGAARGFLRHFNVNYVSVRDGGDTTYTAYGLTGLPETYFIDPRGRIVIHSVGRLGNAELAANLQTLLRRSK